MNFLVHFSVHFKNNSKGICQKSGPIHNSEVFFIGQCVENYDFLFGKSLEFLIHKKIAMVGAFFDEKYTKKPWFCNRKMN